MSDVYDNRGFMLEEWIYNDDMLVSLSHKKVLVGELLKYRLENKGLRERVRFLEMMPEKEDKMEVWEHVIVTTDIFKENL